MSSGITWAIASASLGMHAVHTLERKVQAIHNNGYRVMELRFGDLVQWARTKNPNAPPSTAPAEWAEAGEPDPSDVDLWDILYKEAQEFRLFAESFGIRIAVLQPLNQFDGWETGNPRREWSRRKAERWIKLCHVLGVDLIQVGSDDKKEASSDMAVYVNDLRWIAEIGASYQPPVKIAYEVWCFSHHINTWEQTWDIVQAADHPNLGLCLDVAHFPLAPSYGWDVRTGKGFDIDAFRSSLDRLTKVPADKIFYVEVSDMVKPTPPLGEGSMADAWNDRNRPARGDRFAWTVCGRPVPLVGLNAGQVQCGEDKVDGRVVPSLKAILRTGFRGLICFEMFEAEYMEAVDETVPDSAFQVIKRSTLESL